MEKHALWAPNTENSEKAKLCILMYTPVASSEFSYYLLFCILWTQGGKFIRKIPFYPGVPVRQYIR